MGGEMCKPRYTFSLPKRAFLLQFVDYKGFSRVSNIVTVTRQLSRNVDTLRGGPQARQCLADSACLKGMD